MTGKSMGGDTLREVMLMPSFEQPARTQIDLAAPAQDLSGNSTDAGTFAAEMGISADLERVLSFTRQLFPRVTAVFRAEDPEISGDAYLVFKVEMDADVDEIVAKEVRWHENLLRTVRRPYLFRLCADLQ
jgi:hypothetical protein